VAATVEKASTYVFAERLIRAAEASIAPKDKVVNALTDVSSPSNNGGDFVRAVSNRAVLATVLSNLFMRM
jgi:hypothetical protein